MGARRERGQYGNTRGKERQKRRRSLRENDPRYKRSMEEVRDHQKLIEALAKRSDSPPSSGKTELTYTLVSERQKLLDHVSQEVVKPTQRTVKSALSDISEIEWYGDGQGDWSLRDAAEMLAQGYTLRKTVKTTGWGAVYFIDLVEYLDDDAEAQALLTKIRISLED